MIWKTIAAAGLLALAAGSANATTSITFYSYGAGAPVLTTVDSFSTDTIGSAPSSTAAYSWTGGEIFKGTSSISAAPATSPTTRDTGKYLAILLGNTATLSLIKPISEIEVYIGSLDNYNSISFSDGESFTGSQLGAVPGVSDNSSQTMGSANGLFDFKFSSPVDSVSFLDNTHNSFEIADISTMVSDVPEPGIWAIMVLGLFGIGSAMRHARRFQSAIPANV